MKESTSPPVSLTVSLVHLCLTHWLRNKTMATVNPLMDSVVTESTLRTQLPWLQQISLSRMRVRLEAQEPVRLANFTLNSIRGWLGPALMRVEFCSFLNRAENKCPPCISPAGCTFHYFFEGQTPNATKPFVLELVNTDQTGTTDHRANTRWNLRQGETLAVQFTLIGKGTLHQDKVAVAYLRLDRGARLFNSLFKVSSIHAVSPDDELTQYEVGKRQHITLDDLMHTARYHKLADARRLKIRYLTPASLMNEGRLLKGPEQLTFEFLSRRLIYRFHQLAQDHCDSGSGKSDISSLLKAADHVRLHEADLRWHEEDRYSRRQDQEQSFGGYTGWQIFKGDFQAFLPLLLLGEYLHVGRHATFGFGRIHLEPID